MSFRQFVSALLFGMPAQSDGWASRALQLSLRRVVLSAVAVWEVVMGTVALSTLGFTLPGAALATGYLCLLLYALAAMGRNFPVVPLFIGMYLLGLAGYVASGDPGSALTVATCWLINAASCGVGLLVPGLSGLAVVLVPEILISAGIVVALPGWGWGLPVTIPITQISILVVIRLSLPALHRFARQADDRTASAERAIRDAGILHSASRKIAEDARILHDTAINTLGAIANGGAAIADLRQVREQCARDVSQLETLRSSRSDVPEGTVSLEQVFAPAGIVIRRSGLGDEELRQVAGRVSRETTRVLVGCIREAVTNAAKHSGADHVVIDVTSDRESLVVSVSDSGRGFDGRMDAGRGLANSVFARAEAGGVDARLMTAPGNGTEIRLKAALLAEGADPEPGVPDIPATALGDDVGGTVARLQTRAGSLWGAGVTVVSIVLTARGGTNNHLALYPMIVVMGLCWAAAVGIQRRSAGGGAWRGAVLVFLLLAAPGVFVFSAAAVDFGSDGAVDWQALAATGPFVLLLSLRPAESVFRTGIGIWAAVVLFLTAVIWRTDPNSAAIVLIAGCVGVGFAIAWTRFQNAISSIGERSSAVQREEFAANLASEMQAAAQATFRRWVDAGLDHAVALLRRIAGGDLSPAAEETRDACDREEIYLRQLTLVSPELIHLGHAVMPVLAAARARRVHFTVRLGERDAPDEATAREIAELMLGAVAVTPGEGALTATVFPVRDGLQTTLIGPHSSFGPLARDAGATSRAALHYERVGESDLLQLSFAVEA